ncbi:hypothetical protein ACGF5F_15820 [Streptomyces sp. NPDC047821]|uniref:hypothetical protein n=1 Tax=Streptomyces sp. NPDC047821 TaxID=3365488 RepID=UPI0037241B26
MHATLTEDARCLFGDEYRPTPPCDHRHDEAFFIERLTFADADAILAMLRELTPNLVDGYLPVRIRNLAYRLVLLQRPDDPALMREAAGSLYLHGPDWDDIAADLEKRADALEAASPGRQGVTGEPAAGGSQGDGAVESTRGTPP